MFLLAYSFECGTAALVIQNIAEIEQLNEEMILVTSKA